MVSNGHTGRLWCPAGQPACTWAAAVKMREGRPCGRGGNGTSGGLGVGFGGGRENDRSLARGFMKMASSTQRGTGLKMKSGNLTCDSL